MATLVLMKGTIRMESELSISDAGQAFAAIVSEPEKETKEAPEEKTLEQRAQELEAPEVKEEETEAEPEEEQEAEQKITIEVDGKLVELTPAEIAESYKNGLRQADYTKKTMEAAEARKTAEAEYAKAANERAEYSEKLNFFANNLQAQLQEQSQINWAQLLEENPVEYLKQQHLYNDRQAKLIQAQQEQQRVFEINQQEQQKAYQTYIANEQQQLIAKLPSWSDETKAKSEKAEIKNFLLEQGFSEQDIAQVADHRHVLLVRQAMQFAKLLKSAPEATKRVATAPVKVERSGTAENKQLDGRTRAMQKLGRTGSIQDAAAVFASIL